MSTRKGRKGKVKKGKGREEICIGTRKGRKEKVRERICTGTGYRRKKDLHGY